MIPTVIERDILVEAPVDVVWRVVTEPAQITRWFSDTADVDVRPGGDGTLVFDQQATSQRFTVPIVVESVEPPHRFTFRWSHPDGERPRPGNSMLVEFTLTAEGDGTRVRVVETGLHELAWSDEQKSAYVDDHLKGWDIHLGRMREYVPSLAAR